MKRTLSVITEIIVLSAFMALTGLSVASAQAYENTPVTISKEKVKVSGKLCYSHVVLEKQTLYSISKAYNVSIEDIYSFNPGLKESGLKKNSIILIPVTEVVKEEVKISEVPEEKPVTEQTPVAKPMVKKEAKASKKKIHVRKWYEDLEMIAKHYGVTVEDIMAANNLTDTKLTNRQKLVIPSARKEDSQTEYSEAPVEFLPESETNENTEEADSSNNEISAEKLARYSGPVKATMLLPLRNAEGKLSKNNMDFYSGAMLAVYDLAQKGIDIDINTYDLADQTISATKEDIENSDIIIGPISAADQTRVLQSSDSCMLISPLDPRAEKLVAQYGRLIQAPTPHRVQYQDLTNWIKEEMGENDKVIMFSERTARVSEAVNTMKEVMDSSGIAYAPFEYSILEGRDILEPLKGLMTPEGINRIYIASESEAFVNDVVRNLNLMLLENFAVVLYAPSRVRNFETIEVDHFHKTSMRVSLTYYINYEDQAVKDFLMKYRAIYNTEPTQFAFQGYDIATYFINLYSKYGKDWMDMLESSSEAMLQSTFRFTKQETGGYTNTGVRRIEYGPKWKINQIR
jgi:LysM repeat protein